MIEETRAVDVQLNAAVARALKASGVTYLAFMSAVAAAATASATGSGAAARPREFLSAHESVLVRSYAHALTEPRVG